MPIGFEILSNIIKHGPFVCQNIIFDQLKVLSSLQSRTLQVKFRLTMLTLGQLVLQLPVTTYLACHTAN